MIISCVMFYRYISTKQNQLVLPTKTLYRDEIKSGDIFLVDWQRNKNVFLASMFKNSFMHPAIAVWENNDLYIIELINYFRDEKYRGFIKIPFNKWYRINRKGLILHNPLLIEDDRDSDRKLLTEKILNFYNTYKPKIKEPSGFGRDWIRFWYPPDKYQKIENFNSIICTEIISFLLAESDVIEKDKSIQSYVPDSFIGMQDFKTKDPYTFKDHALVKIQEK